MSRVKKVFNAIFYFLTVLLLFILYTLNFNLGYVSILFMKLASSEMIRLIITALCISIGMISVVKLCMSIFKKSEERYMSIYDEAGEVGISDYAVEKIASITMSKYEEVVESYIRARLKNKNALEYSIVVDIKCGVDEEFCNTDSSLSELSKKIQGDVHISLEKFLGMRVDEVNIRIYNLKKKEKNSGRVDKDNYGVYNKKQSRVK